MLHVRVTSQLRRLAPMTGTGLRFSSQDSFLGKFAESFKRQMDENRQLKENIKLLQAETNKMAESDALKRAKQVYDKAKTDVDSTASASTEKLKQGVNVVASTVKSTVDKVAETKFVQTSKKTIEATTEKVSETLEPIKNSAAYHKLSESVSEAKETMFDEAVSARYGGVLDKETRQRLKEKREKELKDMAKKKVAANPNAGSSVVVKKEGPWAAKWNQFKKSSGIAKSLGVIKSKYETSESPVIEYTRSLTESFQEKIAGLFQETETAKVIRQFQIYDPTFNPEIFLAHAREVMIPELMESFLQADIPTLKEWCSESTFNVLTAGIKAQLEQNLIPDCRMLDLRDVEIAAMKILPDNELPVVVLRFTTQEVIMFRHKDTKEILFGKEDNIEMCTYAAVFTRDEAQEAVMGKSKHEEEEKGAEEDASEKADSSTGESESKESTAGNSEEGGPSQGKPKVNSITGGWKVIEMAKHDARPTW